MEQRKIIITLNKGIFNGEETIDVIYADTIIIDSLTGGMICYVIDKECYYLPPQNVLGTHSNIHFKANIDNTKMLFELAQKQLHKS